MFGPAVFFLSRLRGVTEKQMNYKTMKGCHPNKQIGCFLFQNPRRDESMQARFFKKEAVVIGWAGFAGKTH